MLPLLAMGLMMAGGGWANQALVDRRREQGAARVAELLGTAPEAMGPPDEAGGMGRTGGSGLLGNLNDPVAQAKFAQGLLTLSPQQAELAARTYGDLFSRVQQQGQFDQTMGQRKAEAATQQSQYAQTEKRLTDQFAQQFGLSQAEAERRAREFTQGQQNWQAQFDRQNQQWLAGHGLDVARFNLEKAKGAGAGMPELPKGYTWAQSANGVVAMPLPGTKDYADATAGEQALAGARANINRFLDVFAGNKTGPQGTRVGGTGTELTGEKAGELSTLRAKIVADVAKLRDMGVLQAGELERIEEQLTDPTGWASGLKSNSRITRAYETLGGQFDDKLRSHRNANPWLLPPPPPGAVVDGAGPVKKPDAAPIARATASSAPSSAPPALLAPAAPRASGAPANSQTRGALDDINAEIWRFLNEPPPHRRAR